MMSMLRGIATIKDGWYELTLTDLKVVGGGKTEDAMLAAVEHLLFSHYAIARRKNLQPFAHLVRDSVEAKRELAPEGPIKIGRIKLPSEIWQALADVLHSPKAEPTINYATTTPKAA